MPKALIVVDVQVDFCEGGALAVEGGNTVAENLSRLLSGAHDYDFLVATRDHHISPGGHFSDTPDFIDSWPPHCVVGTAGQELHPALSDFDFDAIFDKGSYEAAYSGFEGTISGSDSGVALGDWLRDHNVDEVDVCGLATDFCVRATAEDAAALGFETSVLGDLVAAVHPLAVPAVIEELRKDSISWKP